MGSSPTFSDSLPLASRTLGKPVSYWSEMFDLPVRIGRWTIDRLLGRGGMATVLLGVDDGVVGDGASQAPRYAAVKLLHPGGPRIRARFAR